MKVKVATATGTLDQFGKAIPAVEKELAGFTKEAADPYVPYRSGALAREAYVKGNKVVYDQSYAHRLYYANNLTYEAEHPERKFKTWSHAFHISRAIHPKATTFWYWSAQQDLMQEYRKKTVAMLAESVKKK